MLSLNSASITTSVNAFQKATLLIINRLEFYAFYQQFITHQYVVS